MITPYNVLKALQDWERHEQVRIAVLKYLNNGIDAPKGWTRVGHPLFDAVAAWWLDERQRLDRIFREME
jgi:hypothetical protein